MISSRDKLSIRKRVLEVIYDNKDDVKGLYLFEPTGELFCEYRIADDESEKLEAIRVEAVTKTRVSVAITIRSTVYANIPEVYNLLQEEIRESLEEIKYTLYDFKMKVIDLE